MKLLDHLPVTINVRSKNGNKQLSLCLAFNSASNSTQRENIIREIKKGKGTYRIVGVLSKKLRGRTDLHGKPYQPTIWLFTNHKIKVNQ